MGFKQDPLKIATADVVYALRCHIHYGLEYGLDGIIWNYFILDSVCPTCHARYTCYGDLVNLEQSG